MVDNALFTTHSATQLTPDQALIMANMIAVTNEGTQARIYDMLQHKSDWRFVRYCAEEMLKETEHSKEKYRKNLFKLGATVIAELEAMYKEGEK